jgi:prepilin-type processing-associated H-X9-DG protein
MHANPIATRASDRQLRAFTVLELLIAFAIIGVLLGLLFPALMSAREAARRQQCANNLRQIGVAALMHHDSLKQLPEAWRQSTDQVTGYGWAIALMPFLEETAMSKSINPRLPLSAAQHELARQSELAVMKCPSDISEVTFELRAEMPLSKSGHNTSSGMGWTNGDGELLAELPSANYVGVFGTVEADDTFPAPSGDGPIVYNRRVRLADLQRGESKTLLIGERTAAMVPSTWLGVNFRGEDAACRLVGSAITKPCCDFCDECEFASRHSSGSNFVWADGHVSLVDHNIDTYEYQSLSKRR